MLRRKSRRITVGNVPVGGGAPITVQSMTKTDTKDINATLSQIVELQKAGCEILRISVPDEESLEAFGYYLNKASIPLIADIHFNHKLAIECIKLGASCVRINPGNIGGKERVLEVVKAAREHNCAIRIGVNAGSLEKGIMRRFGMTPRALAESALYWSKFLEDQGFLNFKVSIKSSDVRTTYEAHIIFAEKSDVPIHLGITEAGFGEYGIVKSSVGIGSLLLNGIGDTIRVSLTGDPVKEVKVGKYILQCLGLRSFGPEIISCPTCSRKKIDVEELAKKVAERLKDVKIPLKVAVMGCEVNGPGEAREADCGIAGGKRFSLVFKKGKVVAKAPNDEALDVLIEIIKELEENNGSEKAAISHQV